MKTLIGATFQQYLLLDVLYSGLDFSFYAAQHAQTGRAVVVEAVFPMRACSSRFSAFFQEAVQRFCQFDHPTLPDILEYGVSAIGCFLVYDLEPSDWKPFQMGTALPEAQAAALCSQVANVLDYLHRHGVVHGYLAPENLLQGEAGQVYVLNYGFAEMMNWQIANWAPETLTGFGVGNPAFLSPERFCGNPPATTDDIYALGALFYALLTGRAPVSGSTLAEIALKTISQPSTHRLPRKLSSSAAGFLRKSLAVNPENRLNSANEARNILDQIASSKKVRHLVYNKGV